MVSVVNVEECNGSGAGTWTPITSGRYCTRDAYNPQLQDPCIVPLEDFNRSWAKSHRLAWTAPSVSISDIRWYTSGNIKNTWHLGTGGMLLVCVKSTGDNGCPTGSYSQATGVQGTSGDDVDNASVGHPYYKSGTDNHHVPVDADTYLAGTPLLVDSNVYGATSGHSYHVVTQALIAPDAIQGDQANETITWRYNEI